jgi:hypothetical protein
LAVSRFRVCGRDNHVLSRAVSPFRSLSMARGCARIDSRLPTAKTCSNGSRRRGSHPFRAVSWERKNVFARPEPERTSWLSGGCNRAFVPADGSCPRPNGPGRAARRQIAARPGGLVKYRAGAKRKLKEQPQWLRLNRSLCTRRAVLAGIAIAPTFAAPAIAAAIPDPRVAAAQT